MGCQIGPTDIQDKEKIKPLLEYKEWYQEVDICLETNKNSFYKITWYKATWTGVADNGEYKTVGVKVPLSELKKIAFKVIDL